MSHRLSLLICLSCVFLNLAYSVTVPTSSRSTPSLPASSSSSSTVTPFPATTTPHSSRYSQHRGSGAPQDTSLSSESRSASKSSDESDTVSKLGKGLKHHSKEGKGKEERREKSTQIHRGKETTCSCALCPYASLPGPTCHAIVH